jgi:hypothetical protein
MLCLQRAVAIISLSKGQQASAIVSCSVFSISKPGHNSNEHATTRFLRHLTLWVTCVHCASELTQLKRRHPLQQADALQPLLTPHHLFLLAFLQLPDD